MDTREKIIGLDRALELVASGATVVRGYFDPLVAAAAARLEEYKSAGTPLLIVIATPADPILPARARAELVAGLRAVDYVTEADIHAQICLEQEHTKCFERLVAHVHARQHAAAS